MRRFAALWPEIEKVQTLSAQIGWSHHQLLLDAFADDPAIHAWYAAKAAENRWPVRHLKGQIDLRLHERQGAALTNFPRALEPTDAGRALEATKDPYIFDFLELAAGPPSPRRPLFTQDRARTRLRPTRPPTRTRQGR